MKVAITVDNDGQHVELSRTRSEGMSRILRAGALEALLDLAVTDTRRAVGLPVPTPEQRHESLVSALVDAERAFAGGTQLDRAEHLARCIEEAGDHPVTSSERPGCATAIREASEVTTEVRLLALPPEPSVGSRVELRGPTRTFPYVRVETTPTEMYPARSWRGDTHAAGFSRTWRELCAQALSGELWLTREGPAEEATGG